MNNEQLCIPIYLNDKIVMDLLAIFEDGFSNVRQIKSVDELKNSNDQGIKGKISTSNLFNSLLGISLEADKIKSKEQSNANEIITEKVHTNVSLFSKLRSKLYDENLLRVINEKKDLSEHIIEGSFVEIQGKLSDNPMIEMLNTFLEVYEMYTRMYVAPELGVKKSVSTKRKEDEAILKQIRAIRDDLIKSDTKDLLLTNTMAHNIILPSHIDRFIDIFDSDLYDGTYKVVGKVIKIIDEDSKINLFRKSSFKIFGENMLVEMMNKFNEGIQSVEAKGLELPNVNSYIEGPGAIVLPIGIFV